MNSVFQLHNLILVAGVWAVGNGILHDTFVLLERRPYERELIRLLIDGHILIFSGVVYLLCYSGIKEQQVLAFSVSIAVALFLLGYCALIFKMLPSALTMVINLAVLVWLVVKFPQTV